MGFSADHQAVVQADAGHAGQEDGAAQGAGWRAARGEAAGPGAGDRGKLLMTCQPLACAGLLLVHEAGVRLGTAGLSYPANYQLFMEALPLQTSSPQTSWPCLAGGVPARGGLQRGPGQGVCVTGVPGLL